MLGKFVTPKCVPGDAASVERKLHLHLNKVRESTRGVAVTDEAEDGTPALRKTSIIDRELLRLRVDIAALQETRLADEGSLRENNYTFFWKGKDTGERREHGVGFAVKNSLLSCIDPPTGVSERIMVLKLQSTSGSVTVVSAYAPTLKTEPEIKDNFYEALRCCLDNVRTSDKLLLLGDFNARIGNNAVDWPECMGHQGVGHLNDNGQRLLELCASHSLCITNTYFKNKLIHKVSWKHPRSGHWHQLDHIITRRRDLCDILNSRTYHSAICDTDHSMVMAKTRLLPKKIHSAKTNCRKLYLNTRAMLDKDLCAQFSVEVQDKVSTDTIDDSASAEEAWLSIKNVITDAALRVFGKKGKDDVDWFSENESVLRPLIEKKRASHICLLNDPENHVKQTAYKSAKSELQRISRHCANVFWVSLCERIQHCRDIGDFRGMYQGIKCATGPTCRKRAAIKDSEGHPITNREDGKLFNISLLKSKKNRLEILTRELLYADDAALVANSEEDLQELVTRFEQACRQFSMSVNTKKTVVMAQGVVRPPSITLNNSALQVVDLFCYLGSTTTSALSNDKELETRIGRASTTFGKLYSRVWRNEKLSINTKVLVYQTCVLSVLLYASETLTTYAKHERKLNAFHMRCLRSILGVTWRDHMSNQTVLSKTHCSSITAILKQRRLTWLGHVHRMDASRLPRQVMLGQIANARRPVGRPKLRFKDCCKRDLICFDIHPHNWESQAEMRPEWRRDLKTGVDKHDKDWLENLRQKRLRAARPPPLDSRHVCDCCGRRCRSGIGLFSHRRRCNQPPRNT
ncbi:uncharacterized protein LOC133533309 [Cydia pomonella]|uniref:uncharacterized protein LOC133533309 n=1 Tax=Cydia pomonella TaxID=82600 RepID=UPI002ADDF7FB|nr:uncharacterized protein LOC133533309 [Cydia pomonella]